MQEIFDIINLYEPYIIIGLAVLVLVLLYL